jgi:hypothetical protein
MISFYGKLVAVGCILFFDGQKFGNFCPSKPKYKKDEGTTGIEPVTYWTAANCSTAELNTL